MLPHPAIEPSSPQRPSEMSIAELDAACTTIAAQGGEMGEIARRILAISNTLQSLTDEADAFLARHRA